MASNLILVYFGCLFFSINVQIVSCLNDTLSLDEEYFDNATVGALNVTGFEDGSEVQVENTTGPPTEPSGTAEPNTPEYLLPVSGRLPIPVNDVGKLCPCDKQQDVCDTNCCCDRACKDDLSLFTSCSVDSVRGSRQLCRQEVALYSLRTTIDGYSELQSDVQTENNQDVFCIHSKNRVDSLSHRPPILPTDRNFDSIFDQFSGYLFGQQDSPLEPSAETEETSGYKFGDIILTVKSNGQKGEFPLPAPGVSADCLDSSPAGFLMEQISQCSRRFSLEQDCISLPALSMDTFTNIQLSGGKWEGAPVVDIEVVAVIIQYPDGILDELSVEEIHKPSLINTTVCANVVKQVVYVLTYNPAGEIVNASVSVKLGFVSEDQIPLQQDFHVKFVQEDNENVEVNQSGNPGYQDGLPLVSARSTAAGLTRSIKPEDTLSLIQPGGEQSCLRGPHQYSPVLFAVDSISGCTLSLVDVADCTMLFEIMLEALRGPNYPQFVASFGNSPLENTLDWVPIRTSKIPAESEGCSIPLARHIEIEWTKFGSLMNPQAQIVSVKEFIYTNTSRLDLLSGGSNVLPIVSSVSFVPVSSPAKAGYRATPTIDAKLPVDFFFPFV